MISAAGRTFGHTPTSIAEATRLLGRHPHLTVVAGGTDVMVGINSGRTTVEGWLSVRQITELQHIERRDDGSIRIGAGVTMSRIADELEGDLPALAQAALTVGSPQIRNAATIGGNLATGSPAGDTLTPLACLGAEIELVSEAGGARRLAITDFLLGPKRSALRAGELITAVHVPRHGGVQLFAKLGPRGAMVIAVCNIAATLDIDAGAAAVAIGSVGPTVVVVDGARDRLLDPEGAEPFAAAVGAAASPIDDLRGTAEYRLHSVRVVARRMHRWLHDDAAGARSAS